MRGAVRRGCLQGATEEKTAAFALVCGVLVENFVPLNSWSHISSSLATPRDTKQHQVPQPPSHALGWGEERTCSLILAVSGLTCFHRRGVSGCHGFR